jgi:F-type H+-transporting ATPase subunit epsilon
VAELQVDIVTPERLVYSGTATDLVAPSWEGEVDILPGHTLYLALLHGGILRFDSDDGPRRFVVGRGFVEAGPDRVTILTDRCMSPEQVDKAEAEARLQEAEEALLDSNAYDEAAMERVLEKLEVARAMVDIGAH